MAPSTNPLWAVALDANGETVSALKVINDGPRSSLSSSPPEDGADEMRWVMDISGRASTLLLALLAAHDQHVVCVPGRTVNRMSVPAQGEGKSDAKDARIVADQARMRPKGFASLDTPPD